jgi:HEAT repeat protein
MSVAVPACFSLFVVCFLAGDPPAETPVTTSEDPYSRQVATWVSALSDRDAQVRAGAAESLGFLRAYDARSQLVDSLRDEAKAVRRTAALALAWCGDREAIAPLLDTLRDPDWLTRQAAHVALTNLTGLEFPFDATAPPRTRRAQAMVWRDWWAEGHLGESPADVLQLLDGPRPWLQQRRVLASTTYKGPPEVVLDGMVGPRYWQTKNVRFPQHLIIDLGKSQPVHQVVVHQYGPRFVMTNYSLAVSEDNERFETVIRRRERSPVRLMLDAGGITARYVRITSHDSANPIYPTTFLEVEVNGSNPSLLGLEDELIWRYERGARALGVLGNADAAARIVKFLGPTPPAAERMRPAVTAAIRSLGRLRQDTGFAYLLQLLDNPMWARRAAEALGDYGDARAVPYLAAAFTRYAKRLDGSDPPDVPHDDKMTFPSEDRMLETPYAILLALSRLDLEPPQHRAALQSIAPQLLANQPGDHDTFFLYEQEPAHQLIRYLLDKCGVLDAARAHVFALLSPSAEDEVSSSALVWPVFAPYRASSWLPTLCTDQRDLPRLLALLQHDEGWVRLNAAKAIAWLGDPRAIGPLAELLRSTPPEADFGLSGTFKDEEYNDPAPRWREGLIRAMGLLGAHNHTQLIIDIMNDERSVLEVRRAAADALSDLGNDRALAALRQAARQHTFFSIRQVARDAVRRNGLSWKEPVAPTAGTRSVAAARSDPQDARLSPAKGLPDAIVFLKGSNNIPNTVGTVEQADRWRQTYVVTDSGPAYRPARNLYLLRPPTPDGEVTPLTEFADGYVAEPELSWDARHVVFCRRGQFDPWWQIWRVNLDGTGLTQLTDGPYHHVGPAYLPDGRLVCASSRLGIRDEYHGYPCTGLVVMNPDGTGIEPIATNIGRDNEPAVLYDGRLVFSRLEVFYSRNKTELTLHAAHPDGTQDVVIYGPERREFWRALDHGPPTPADGQEAPLTHRVLRMTQPQPMPDRRSVVAVTQGGLILVGPPRDRETFISPDNKRRAYTTPFPLPDGRVLCASTLKVADRAQVDLGIYLLDPQTRSLQLVYNDPLAADFEARPVLVRQPPPAISSTVDQAAYTGRFLCSSVFDSQEPQVPTRGRLVRLIEGMPMVARHSTQTNPWEVWKNHGGTLARVLGTVPLAADGSFYVEAPADRLLHFQVLDSDRRVVGNQLTWIYTRPGETKSCVGCHESPHTTTGNNTALAGRFDPARLLPHPGEFRYRAKAWFKGSLPAEIEERTRTVRAVNLLGR